MALDAIIFDVDGTLVDTNAAHVEAWDRALRAHGYTVSKDRIEVEVGKGGDKLVPSILGEAIAKRQSEELGKAHTAEYTKIAESRTLPAFEGVVELLKELRQRGIRTAIATSSKKGELATVEETCGLKLTEMVDEVVTSDDAEESKPSPDIVAAAVKKLKLSPLQCAMVGDTPYDVHAARDAGVGTVGFTCGGVNDADTLRHAGARVVCTDPADLLRSLDRVLERLSPGKAHLTEKVVQGLMRETLAVAREGMAAGEAPIGCVLARGDGTVIARGFNRLNATQNKTAHAEIVAFAAAAGRVPTDARDLILVSTLEPCVMCLGACMEAAVDAVVYALHAPADGGTARVQPPVSPESQMPRIWGGVMAGEGRKLFEEFLPKAGNEKQRDFVEQLLAMTEGGK